MPKTQLALNTLKYLEGGRVTKTFDELLRRAVKDCMDRPSLDKRREITIRVVVEPILDDEGPTIECKEVKVTVHLGSKLPGSQSKPSHMLPNVNGQLAFNPNLPELPGESTLFDGDLGDGE